MVEQNSDCVLTISREAVGLEQGREPCEYNWEATWKK
jgi:hypothetical protein